MIKFFKGFFTFFNSFNLISKYNLWSYVWIPLSISFILGILFFFFGISFAYQFIHDPYTKFAERTFSEIAFIGVFLEGLIYLIFFVILLLSTSFLYRPIVTIAILPFLETLFERLEKELYPEKNIKQAKFNPALVMAGVLINLKYLVLELLTIPISFFTGPFQPIFLTFAQGYFLGRTSFDYIAAEEAKNIEERKYLIKKYSIETWGLGVAQFILLFIPLIGVVFSPLMGVIGSYIIYKENENNERIN
ncbi:MAG: EI24 domain-containing protein [Leptospiraceae bacterium]|nr:EI24 domain-containing protein [Leptospiraceae bacterium]